jgi:hypothetical protein
VQKDAGSGAVTEELEPTQFCKVMEQGHPIHQDRGDDPNQEQETRGKRHPGDFDVRLAPNKDFRESLDMQACLVLN